MPVVQEQHRYRIHKPSGRIFDTREGKIHPKYENEMLDYTPPQFLLNEKTGRIHGWTFMLVQQPGLVPYTGKLEKPTEEVAKRLKSERITSPIKETEMFLSNLINKIEDSEGKQILILAK